MKFNFRKIMAIGLIATMTFSSLPAFAIQVPAPSEFSTLYTKYWGELDKNDNQNSEDQAIIIYNAGKIIGQTESRAEIKKIFKEMVKSDLDILIEGTLGVSLSDAMSISQTELETILIAKAEAAGMESEEAEKYAKAVVTILLTVKNNQSDIIATINDEIYSLTSSEIFNDLLDKNANELYAKYYGVYKSIVEQTMDLIKAEFNKEMASSEIDDFNAFVNELIEEESALLFDEEYFQAVFAKTNIILNNKIGSITYNTKTKNLTKGALALPEAATKVVIEDAIKEVNRITNEHHNRIPVLSDSEVTSIANKYYDELKSNIDELSDIIKGDSVLNQSTFLVLYTMNVLNVTNYTPPKNRPSGGDNESGDNESGDNDGEDPVDEGPIGELPIGDVIVETEKSVTESSDVENTDKIKEFDNGKEGKEVIYDSSKAIAAIKDLPENSFNVVENEYSNIEVSLSSDIMEALKEKSSDMAITVKSNIGEYVLPVEIIDLEDIKAELGSEDVSIEITIQEPSAQISNKMDELASSSEATMIATPVEFIIEAISGDKRIEINNFKEKYVSRKITLSGDIDVNKAVGVKLDEDKNEYVPVPTKFYKDEKGNFVANLKKKGNSIYTVVKKEKTFGDIIGHWGKNNIETLASKMIISGMTEHEFAPDESITRAQFATFLVNALGIESSNLESNFNDVSSSDWFSEDVNTAASEGLVTGYSDKSFKPNKTINREEMAIMIVRGLGVAEKEMKISDSEKSSLLIKFADKGVISSWAEEEVAIAVKENIINGKTASTFVPKDYATRAEAAAMLIRMMKAADFMN